ncbi:hypothetical protein FrEUN1fDRAFT_7392, partial [Parafrankia sp. EUN1f]
MSRRLGARSAMSTFEGTSPAEATDTSGPLHTTAGADVTVGLRSRARRRAIVTSSLAAAAIAASALSGCASGTDALTNAARTTTNSVSGAVGSVTLRNVYVAGPADKGDSAQIISA